MFCILCILVGVVTLAMYHLKEAPISPANSAALKILHESPGPVFTMNPIWAEASGQTLYPWPFACDFGNDWQYRQIPASDYTTALLHCPIVALDHRTMSTLSAETEQYLRKHYKTVFISGSPLDRKYIEILRKQVP